MCHVRLLIYIHNKHYTLIALIALVNMKSSQLYQWITNKRERRKKIFLSAVWSLSTVCFSASTGSLGGKELFRKTLRMSAILFKSLHFVKSPSLVSSRSNFSSAFQFSGFTCKSTARSIASITGFNNVKVSFELSDQHWLFRKLIAT